MKKIILTSILIIGLTATYSVAQMGQGHMMGNQPQQQSPDAPYGGGYYPGPMGPGMMGGQGMGPGMMGGYGMGPGMMGPGHMGGYGMMGQGHMGGMMGRGMMGYGGGGMRGYDPEAYQKYEADYQKYLDDTAALRKKLHNKKFEYFEALRHGDTKGETVIKLEKEIYDLKWDIYEKAPR
jgi:hypothetical protein